MLLILLSTLLCVLCNLRFVYKDCEIYEGVIPYCYYMLCGLPLGIREVCFLIPKDISLMYKFIYVHNVRRCLQTGMLDIEEDNAVFFVCNGSKKFIANRKRFKDVSRLLNLYLDSDDSVLTLISKCSLGDTPYTLIDMCKIDRKSVV